MPEEQSKTRLSRVPCLRTPFKPKYFCLELAPQALPILAAKLYNTFQEKHLKDTTNQHNSTNPNSRPFFTNRKISIISLILSILCLLYFILLLSKDFAIVLSLKDIFLGFSIFFSAAFLIIRKRPSAEKYKFLPKFKPFIRNTIRILISLCLLTGLVCLFFICKNSSANQDITKAPETEWIILLGGGINISDSKLPESPKNRVKAAAAYLKLHPKSKVIVTGGQVGAAKCDEARVMKAELIELGISPEHIFTEDRAQDTIQNYYYSAHIISREDNCTIQQALEKPIVIITSRYHINRAARLSRRMGFKNIYSLPTKTAAYDIPLVYLREIGAYIKLTSRIIFTGQPTVIE